MRAAILAASLVALVAVALASCGGGESDAVAPSPSGQGGGGAGKAGSAGRAGRAGKGGSGGTPAAGAAGDNGLGPGFEGWKRLPTEGICEVWYPSTTGKQLPPLSWTTCPPEWVEGVPCEAAAVDGYKWLESSPRNVFQRISDDEWVFGVYRFNTDRPYYLITWESNKGTVYQSYRIRGGCAARLPFGVSGGRFLVDVSVYKPGVMVSTEGVVAAGQLGDLDPTFVGIRKAWTKSAEPFWSIGIDGVLRQAESEDVLFPMDDPEHGTVIFDPSMDPAGLGVKDVTQTNKGLFLVVSGGYQDGVHVYHGGKAQPFLRYPTTEEAAFGFGADDDQMVWVHGHGGLTGFYRWAVQDIMVAPTTTDPETAKKTAVRLRSETTQSLPWGWKVGCGYAAAISYVMNTPHQSAAIRVVRLSDGWSWVFHSPGYAYPLSAVGVTCDHVYAIAPASQLFRVRLDSLGPGEPPD